MQALELETYLKKIEQLTDNGNLDQASFHCLYLLRQFPKMLRLYEKTGRAFLEKDNYSGALSTYLRLCAAQPDNFLSHISLVYTYAECGRPGNAIEHCQAAICLQQGNPQIEEDLNSWMEDHSLTFSMEDRCLTEFSQGIENYRAKNYTAAIGHFLAAENRPFPNLPALYLGLCCYANGALDKAVCLLRSVLKNEPYNQTALRRLCVYYEKRDQMKFKHCLDRLIELDPHYARWEIRDGQIYGQFYPINIAYYDWTGVPKTRVRIGWQQASEKLINNDNSRLPEWLDLLPITGASSGGKSAREILASLTPKNPTDNVYRKSYFSEKTASQQQEYEQEQELTTPKPQPKSQSSELDQAFSYLSQIAEKGMDAVSAEESAANEEVPVPVPTKTIFPGEDPSQAAKDPPAADPTPEERQRLRDAWRFFSTDQAEQGVQLYRELIERKNCAAAVKEDLEKLIILFPDTAELPELLKEIQS